MDQEHRELPPTSEMPDYSVPWKPIDNWIGVALLVMIDAALIVLVLRGTGAQLVQNAGILLLELAYLLPVVIILAGRRIHWKNLGFGKFNWNALGLGCSLLIGGYMLILVHNGILLLLGVDTQGEAILKIFESLDSPVWFFIVAVIFAPLVEEIFFRGFLFQGFRQKYGWLNATLLSSAIFAAAHLDLVSLIPTFILGTVLAYTYHKSNSVWPGIILHFLVNAFGICGAYAATQLQNVIPL